MLDSTPFWAESEVTMAPVVETEAVHNTNLKVELSENAEIIAALHSFLTLHMSPAFQRNSETILGDGLSDRIKVTFEEFKGNGLCNVHAGVEQTQRNASGRTSQGDRSVEEHKKKIFPKLWWMGSNSIQMFQGVPSQTKWKRAASFPDRNPRSAFVRVLLEGPKL